MPSFSKLFIIAACTLAIATGSVAASDIAVDQPQPARNLRAEAVAVEADQAVRDSAPQRGLQAFSRPIDNASMQTQFQQAIRASIQRMGGGSDQRSNGGGGGGQGPDGRAFSSSWTN